MAREKPDHLQQTPAVPDARGIVNDTIRPSRYALDLHGLVRREEPDRLLDLLTISALIEARSCERFHILATGLEDSELRDLYGSLLESEARHHGIYFELATELAGREVADARMRALAEEEAAIVAKPCDWVRLHAG